MAERNKNSNSSICIVLLMGLPGAGKTSFITKFGKELSEKGYCFIHVCYDRLIQIEDLSDLTSYKWKGRRSEIKTHVEELVRNLRDNKTTDGFEDVCGKLRIDNPSINLGKESVVIFVDDNFYYRSMRYEYYQISKKHEVGFCQFHIDETIEECLKRNRSRKDIARVPEETILHMSEKFECANPFENSWEKFSFSLKGLQESLPLELCQSVIDLALTNPFKNEDEVNAAERDLSRMACSASVVHQADKILRRHVNERAKEARESNPSNMEEVCKSLNICRTELLEDLRTGFTKLPVDLVKNIEGREDGAIENLSVMISELFLNKLQNQQL